MKSSFSGVSDFLDELGREEVEFVRITPTERAINNGVSELSLRAGFVVGENLNELNQCCGETYQGNESSEVEERYEAFENEIKEFCEAHDIGIRCGEYDG